MVSIGAFSIDKARRIRYTVFKLIFCEVAMKRILSVTLLVLMLLPTLLCLWPAAAAKVPTAEDLCGYENVCLTYTFRRSGADNGRHYEKDLLPYTGYLDTEGNVKDFFFDSYLFLPCMDYGPSGAR